MAARLSILPYQRARAGRTRQFPQTCLTRMIRPSLIVSGVMVSQAGAVERLVPAVVSLGQSASRRSTSQIIALLPRASLSQSMLRSVALAISKVRHIWAATIQQTCARTTLAIPESWVWEQRLGAAPTRLPFRQADNLSWSSTRPERLRRRRSSVAPFPASSTIRPDLAPVRHHSLRNKLIVGESLRGSIFEPRRDRLVDGASTQPA